MPIRELDAETALIVIDFQEGTRRFVGEAGATAYAAAARLRTAFRHHGLPVILVRMAGGRTGRSDVAPHGGDHVFPEEARAFVPEIGPVATDMVIEKAAWGAFAGTELARHLAGLGTTHVVVCGTAASIGVESTARQAYEAGLNVTIACDAVTDFNPDALRNSLDRIFPLLAETGTADDVIALLDARPVAG